MSGRKLVGLVGAALALPLLMLLGPVAQAEEETPCTVAGPTQSPSELVTPGTKIAFSVSCEGKPRTHSIGTTVAQDLDGKRQIVFVQRDTVSLGGGSGATEKTIHIPTPPMPGVGVCIDIDGQHFPPGCTPAGS